MQPAGSAVNNGFPEGARGPAWGTRLTQVGQLHAATSDTTSGSRKTSAGRIVQALPHPSVPRLMRLPRLALSSISLILAAACGGGDSPSEPVDHVTVGSISITSPTDSIILGQDFLASVEVREVSDTVLPAWPYKLRTTDSLIATINPIGLVSPHRPGTVGLIATIDSFTPIADTFVLRVLPRAHSVQIVGAPDTLVISDSVALSAVVRDSLGGILTGRPVAWDFGGHGTVTPAGMVHAESGGLVRISATVEGVLDTTSLAAVLDSPFAELVSGNDHTCGRTTSGRAYCWGKSGAGQVGNIALATSPFPINPALRFTQLAAGGSHNCGLTAAGEVYCWGYNAWGQVGILPVSNAVTAPVKVAGLPAVTRIGGGFEYTCAITAAGATWCWGKNDLAELGLGTADGLAHVPPDTVRGLPPVTDFAGGYGHGCAVGAQDGTLYCWGQNVNATGTGGVPPSPLPTPVSGGLAFASVTAALTHTCGVTTTGAAWCWGNATDGRLGNGSTNPPIETLPVAVIGGYTWASLSANAEHTCGVTTSGEGYCWGNPGFWATGNGGGATPTLVQGGLTFTSIAAGHYHSCGLTTASKAWCWGIGVDGQLGTGSVASSTAPVLVLGQR